MNKLIAISLFLFVSVGAFGSGEDMHPKKAHTSKQMDEKTLSKQLYLFQAKSAFGYVRTNGVSSSEIEECSQSEMNCIAPGLNLEPSGFAPLNKLLPFISKDTGPDRMMRCRCLQTKASISDYEKDQVSTNLKKAARKHLNTKLLNEYSANLENLHYYSINMANIFHSKDEKKRITEAEKIQCSKPEMFLQALKKNKDCKKISPAEQEKRFSDILGSFGTKLNGSLDKKMNQLNKDILGETSSKACSVNFTRECYDKKRFEVSREPFFKSVDKLLVKFLKNPEIQRNIGLKMSHENIPPVEAIGNLLPELIEAGNRDLLLNIFSKDSVGEELYSLLDSKIVSGQKISQVDKNEIMSQFKVKFSGAIELHPGLKRVLQSKEVYLTTLNKLKGDSIVELIEQDGSILKNDIVARCEQIVASFSEAVCSSDDQLLTKTSKEDIAQVAEEEGILNERNSSIIGILACENGIEREEPRALDNLVVHPWLKSDFVETKTVKTEEQRNLYAKWKSEAEKPNSEINTIFDSIAARWGGSSVSLASLSGNKDIFGREVAPAAVTANKAIDNSTNHYDEYSSGYSNQENPFQQMDTAPAEIQPNYSNQLASSQTGVESSSKSSKDKDKENMQKDFNDFLNQKMEKESVDTLMSNANDEMMKQLMELKEEISRNQMKIIELTTQNEKLKLKNLEEKLNTLQTSRAALEEGEPVVKKQQLTQKEPLLQPFNSQNLNTPNVGVNSHLVDAGGAQSGGISGHGSDSVGAGSVNMNSALLSAAAASAGRGPASEGSMTPVVVAASAAKIGAIEIKSQEVGQDLLNYLANNNTDIKTLINLKSSGVLYKYKVLENGKYVEKEILIEYSKLNEDIKKMIDMKIAQNKDKKKEAEKLDKEIKELSRIYSYSALKIILAEQMKSVQ